MSRRLVLVIAVLAASRVALAHDGLPVQVQRLTQALQRDPGSAALLVQRARAFRELGHLKAAQRDLARAVALDDGQHAALTERALVHLAADNEDAALADLNLRCARFPASGRAFYERGKILERRGDFDGARDDYEAAVHLMRTPDAYLARARMDQALDALPRALTDLERGLETLNGAVTLRLELVALAEVAGDLPRAIQHADALAASAPHHPGFARLRDRLHDLAKVSSP